MLYPTELRADVAARLERCRRKKSSPGELFSIGCYWSEYKDSNLGPPGPKPGALPDCATLRQALYSSAVLDFLRTSGAFFTANPD